MNRGKNDTRGSGPDRFYADNCSINYNKGRASSEKPEVAKLNEDVGLNGPLTALPGNNPATKRSRNFGNSFLSVIFKVWTQKILQPSWPCFVYDCRQFHLTSGSYSPK